jgi:hypothetical protein
MEDIIVILGKGSGIQPLRPCDKIIIIHKIPTTKAEYHHWQQWGLFYAPKVEQIYILPGT